MTEGGRAARRAAGPSLLAVFLASGVAAQQVRALDAVASDTLAKGYGYRDVERKLPVTPWCPSLGR